AFKTYPMTSVDLNRALGAFVLERVSTRVDLEHAEQVIHVEVLPAETYISLDRVEGPGGLPVGSSGTVAALLSGGIDSPVGRWRGARGWGRRRRSRSRPSRASTRRPRCPSCAR